MNYLLSIVMATLFLLIVLICSLRTNFGKWVGRKRLLNHWTSSLIATCVLVNVVNNWLSVSSIITHLHWRPPHSSRVMSHLIQFWNIVITIKRRLHVADRRISSFTQMFSWCLRGPFRKIIAKSDSRHLANLVSVKWFKYACRIQRHRRNSLERQNKY